MIDKCAKAYDINYEIKKGKERGGFGHFEHTTHLSLPTCIGSLSKYIMGFVF